MVIPADLPPPLLQAAAIPLPMVKALLGPYLVFLCSTVNGYEGTGRSLSLKLIQQLRQQVRGSNPWLHKGNAPHPAGLWGFPTPRRRLFARRVHSSA